MLFTELACFSPFVDGEIRKLWVTNGGSLTHTEADFRRADFFFCNGLDDPWLHELLSRALIVRHASWVTLCVFEQFRMPVAPYTLDDGFDECEITIMDPLIIVKTSSIRPDWSSVGQKRPREDTDEYLESQPPLKKVKNNGDQVVRLPRGFEDTKSEKPQPSTAYPPSRSLVAVAQGAKMGKVSETVRLFETKIAQPKIATLSPPPTPHRCAPKPRISKLSPTLDSIQPLPLNRHTLFWNDLIARSQHDDSRSGVLALSMDTLLQAPHITAGLFMVNETFLGKKFVNRDYI